MNIIFSHGFKMKSGLAGEAEIVYMHPPDGAQPDDEEYEEIIYIDRETLAQTFEYECSKCKSLEHSNFLENETSKLYKTCNKYKTKLENIRENINNIIKENTDEDDDFYRTAHSVPRIEGLDKRIILDPILYVEEKEDLEEDLPPPLGFF